jgi:hypothetical protein
MMMETVKTFISTALLAVATTTFAAGCGPGDGGEGCSADADCKGDRICESGQCVSPGDTTNSDTSNSDTSNSDTSNSDTSNADTSNNDTSNNDTSNNDDDQGAIGSTCLDDTECDSNYCRTPPGAIEGACADNDFGETCESSDACLYDACVVRSLDDIAGFCTAPCDSFSDCPAFWNCEELENAGGKYCVQD